MCKKRLGKRVSPVIRCIFIGDIIHFTAVVESSCLLMTKEEESI